MGRSTVREALHALARLGILEIRDRHGAFIAVEQAPANPPPATRRQADEDRAG